jgi:LemA protein
MTIIIILAVLALLILWGIGVQRKLVSAEELCKNAMSQIGVQQNSRWDALTALAELVKGYNEHEYKTLMDVIGQRKEVGSGSTAAEAQAQEDLITSVMSRISLVAEQYPNLKADAMYVKTMDSVNTYENQVRMSRMVYNDSVTRYNRLTRQIPDSIVASIFHFTEKEYLKEDASKKDMPSLKI